MNTKTENPRKELLDILNLMDVPEGRKELTKENLCWLGRNLFFKNNNNTHFKKALNLIWIVYTREFRSSLLLLE